MHAPKLRFRLALAILLAAGSASAQEVQDDQDPVDLDWVPAWDAPFWPAPSGAALEIAAGRTGTLAPGASPQAGRIASGEYLLALLTLPFGRRAPGSASATDMPALESTLEGGEGDESTDEATDEAPLGRAPRVRSVARGPLAQAPQPAAMGGASSGSPSDQDSTLEPALDPPGAAAASPAPGRAPLVTRTPRGNVPLALLRDALEHAEQAAGFRKSLTRLSSIGQRARWSGLAPELRLRGATGIDQTRSVDSAGIVPSDETLRDGSDALVEIRLTFHLEKLLHAGQEVALERARQQLLSDRAEVRSLVGQELVTYVRAHRRAEDDAIEDDERDKLEILAERARLSLYLLTDGWFRGEETLSRYDDPAPHAGER